MKQWQASMNLTKTPRSYKRRSKTGGLAMPDCRSTKRLNWFAVESKGVMGEFTIDDDAIRILRIVRAQGRSPSWRTIEESYFQE